MKPFEITILSKTLKLVETTDQFRKENGNRRMGLEYWVAALLDEKDYKGSSDLPENLMILIQYQVDAQTDTAWLKTMVREQRVYLSSSDHLITLAVAKTLKK